MIGEMAFEQFKLAVDFIRQSHLLNHLVNDPDAATGNSAMATIDIVMYIGTTKHRAGLIFPVFFLELFSYFSFTFL
jgi:uracil phosphoribosyltransferase